MRKKGRRSKNITKLKLRQSTRVFFVITALVLFAMSSKNIYVNLFERKERKIEKELYSYSNIYNLDYKVNIKPNQFITEEFLEKDQTYVSDLIDSLTMDIKYDYNSSSDTEILYSYKIDAIITANYNKDGNNYNIWNKTYNIKEADNQSANKNINIRENINVDYNKYHAEIKNFRQSMGMTIDACINIRLTVNTSTNINSQEVKNEYVSDFSITAGDKIAKVEGKSTDSNEKHITDKSIIKSNLNIVSTVINIIILLISIYTIYYIRNKTKILYSIKNDFKLELNRILKSCQDRIIIVKNKVELEQDSTIDVKDFGELIKLSEELYKPILYWISEDNEEAWFSVISNKINYRFILKK